MKKISVFFSLYLVIGSLCAQSNFKEGYIVTASNDSILGMVNYKTDKKNAISCQFKIKGSDEAKDYQPKDLKSYGIYENKVRYISKDIENNSITTRIFVEELVIGKLSLFYYKGVDNNQDYYIFQEGDSSFVVTKEPEKEVLRHKKGLDDATIRLLQKDTKYLGVLNYYFRDYPGTIKQDMKFRRPEMIKLAMKVNSLKGYSVEKGTVHVTHEKESAIRTKFILYTGMTYTKFDGEGYFPKLGKLSAVDPILLGIDVDISDKRWMRDFSFFIDISLRRYKVSKTAMSDKSWSKNPARQKTKSLILDNVFGFRYTYNKKSIKPCFDVGFVYSCWLSRSGKVEILNDGEVNGGWDNAFYPRSSYLGFKVGVGIAIPVKEKYAIPIKLDYQRLAQGDKINSVLLKVGFQFGV